MRYLYRLAVLALLAAVGVWAFLFSLANDATVSLDLVFVQLPELRVSAGIICAFVIGGLCGLIAASAALLASIRVRSSLRRQLREVEARTGTAPD